jgi:hypothetical protein
MFFLRASHLKLNALSRVLASGSPWERAAMAKFLETAENVTRTKPHAQGLTSVHSGLILFSSRPSRAPLEVDFQGDFTHRHSVRFSTTTRRSSLILVQAVLVHPSPA